MKNNKQFLIGAASAGVIVIVVLVKYMNIEVIYPNGIIEGPKNVVTSNGIRVICPPTLSPWIENRKGECIDPEEASQRIKNIIASSAE